MAEKAIYFDSSKCTACKGCQVACKCWNNLPSPLETNGTPWSGTHQNPADINGTTRLIITFNEQPGDTQIKPVKWAFGRRACQHCTDAPCASICPGGALVRNVETGFVEVYQDKCVGCQYCHSVCPFDVPRYESNGVLDKSVIDKCTGCADRVSHGMAPACVSTCQPQALKFGDRDEMIKLGKEKVEWLHENGYPDSCLYGESEMGGLHVIQVLKYGIDAHGQVKDPAAPATAQLTSLMKPITGAVTGLTVVGLAAMFGLAVGYKRDKLAYNPETQDTVSVITGDVVQHGDPQDDKSVVEHITENLPLKKGGKDE